MLLTSLQHSADIHCCFLFNSCGVKSSSVSLNIQMTVFATIILLQNTTLKLSTNSAKLVINCQIWKKLSLCVCVCECAFERLFFFLFFNVHDHKSLCVPGSYFSFPFPSLDVDVSLQKKWNIKAYFPHSRIPNTSQIPVKTFTK